MRVGLSLLVAALAWPITGCGDAILDAVGLPPKVLADGLVAHWALDEGGGTTARDSSGNGHDGQLGGGTWITDGRFGGGLRLIAGDAVAVPGFPAATANWSVSLWIRMSDEQMAFNNNDPFTEILSTENIGSAGWQINIDKRLSQPRFVFSYWAPPLMGYVGTECSCVDTGAWIHLAATVDIDTNRITLYRDGAGRGSGDPAVGHPPRRFDAAFRRLEHGWSPAERRP